MTLEIADQIADLLNGRNQLVTKYTAQKVLNSGDNYVYLLDNKKVIACAESKKVQWYQWEISHISVSSDYEGKGYGSEILSNAEKKAKDGGAKILQCTIRENNENSIKLFSRNEYSNVNKFFNTNSGNWVLVFQKTISKE